MSNPSGVFVGYATSHGSTRSIAERIATRLTDHGLSATISALTVDTDLPPEGPVVVGSAIHNRTWLPTAMVFMHAHEEQLANRPLWLFSVGMAAALPRPLRRLGNAEQQAILRNIGMPGAVRGAALFSGRVEPEHFPAWGSRLAFRLMGCRYGDFRDWEAIDTWAEQIAAELAH